MSQPIKAVPRSVSIMKCCAELADAYDRADPADVRRLEAELLTLSGFPRCEDFSSPVSTLDVGRELYLELALSLGRVAAAAQRARFDLRKVPE